MKHIQLENLTKATGGKCLQISAKQFSGFGTDTRKDLSGKVFIALRGEAFDGHDYLVQAVKAGAQCLLVHRFPEVIPPELSQVTVVHVTDTLFALQSLGSWFRHQAKAKVLGITGSNGKTSTKEFTAQIIETKKKVHWSQGSFNNHWGVPFSLMDLENQHEVAVIEMGMNHAGEIKRLVEIADPDVVVCTMVGRAHIEFFGTQEKIAQAKQEIYLHSRKDSLAIFNLDNKFTRQMWEQDKLTNSSRPRLTFSENEKADVRFKISHSDFQGLTVQGEIDGMTGEAQIPIFGQHNVTNLLAAASLALASGLGAQEIWTGLQKCRSHWGRNQIVKLQSGAVALFDAYNANPDSMEALLANLRSIPAKRKIGVFGQMKELGDLSAQLHEQLGKSVAQSDFAKVFFYGDDFKSFEKGLKAQGFAGPVSLAQDFSKDLAEDLARSLQSGDLVAMKGSRGMKLERMLLACAPIDFSEKS